MKPGRGLAEDRDINQGMENSWELELNQGIGLQAHDRDKGILRRPPLPLAAPSSSSWWLPWAEPALGFSRKLLELVVWGEPLLWTKEGQGLTDNGSGPMGPQLLCPLYL